MELVVIPVTLAELAPARLRSSMVGLYWLSIKVRNDLVPPILEIDIWEYTYTMTRLAAWSSVPSPSEQPGLNPICRGESLSLSSSSSQRSWRRWCGSFQKSDFSCCCISEISQTDVYTVVSTVAHAP